MKVTIDYTWLGKVENEARQSPYIAKRNYLYGRRRLVFICSYQEETEFTEWMN